MVFVVLLKSIWLHTSEYISGLCILFHPSACLSLCQYHSFLSTIVAHSLSRVPLFATPQTVPCQASLSFTIPRSLLKLVSIESVMSSKHLIFCCPLSSCPQSFPASGSFTMSQLFASGDQIIINYWPSIIIISLSNKYSELISFTFVVLWNQEI